SATPTPSRRWRPSTPSAPLSGNAPLRAWWFTPGPTTASATARGPSIRPSPNAPGWPPSARCSRRVLGVDLDVFVAQVAAPHRGGAGPSADRHVDGDLLALLDAGGDAREVQ